jgi:vomeronasal1 receptor
LGHSHSIALTNIVVIRDVLFVALMMCTSLYMVQLLYRHHRRAQHVHSPSLSSQSSPENRATHTILLLLSSFVFFYFLHNVIALYRFHRPEENPHLEKVIGILSLCYPTICPFVLMKNNKFCPLSFLLFQK